MMIPTSLTNEQIAIASRYLAETRDALAESTTGLSASQWTFKPVPELWSVDEIVEHLVLIESAIHGIVGKMSEAPEAPPGFEPAQTDDFILAELHKRTTKVKAPAQACPAHRWSGPEALRLFLDSREQTIQILSASSLPALSLRGHVVPHPLFGPWDGYQWLLATAGHCARHTAQIRELKASPGFLQMSDAVSTLQ
jgi:hypothetical protein